MKRTLPFIILILHLVSIRSQTVNRVEVKGVILTTNTDIEGITIFNTSSNKGTITNDKGEFVIGVALNDRIEVSALQFEPIVVTIDASVISSKELKIFLREHINNLDAVLLTYGLSGDLLVDIKNTKPPPSIDIDFGNMDAYMLKVDKAFDNGVLENELNAIVNKGELHNGINFVEISKLIFKSKKNRTSKNEVEQEQKPKELNDIYSLKVISKTFDIPLEKVVAFIGFVESNGMTQELLKPKNEMQLIEFLMKQRELFLKGE